MPEKEREMKIKSIAKGKGLKTKRMPGKGKEKRYDGFIPDKYKGKLMIVDNRNQGDIYEDDGEGIKEDELPKIFNTDFSKGRFGIGLHFCKKAMERMDGKIECVSKFGIYTEFIISFSKYTDNK